MNTYVYAGAVILKAPLFLALFLSVAAGSAAGDLITFESSSDVFLNPGDSLTEQGYVVTLTTADPSSFAYVTSSGSGLATNGTNALGIYNSPHVIVTAASGGTFNLSAFDVAGTFTGSDRNVQTIGAIGTYSDGTTNIFSGALANPDVFSTQIVSGFTGVVSVEFYGIAGVNPECENCPEFQLDNVQLDASSSIATMTAVPEPGTKLMFALGAALWLPFRLIKRNKRALPDDVPPV